jgi:hypothetical protein
MSQSKKILDLCAVALVFLALSCSEKPAASSISIPFNGILKTDNGSAPVHDKQHNFANFRDRKVLSLKGSNFIQYELSNWDLDQGSLGFWIKLENSAESTLVSLRAKNNTLKVGSNDRFIQIQLSRNGKLQNQQLPRRISPPGIWTNFVLVWSKESYSIYLNGNHVELVESSIKESESPQGLCFGSSENPESFAALLRDFQLESRIPSDQEISASFKEKMEEMEKPLKWNAENLEHFAGKKVSAQGTSNGKAWTVDTLFASRDHIQLGKGPNYRIVFRIKPLTPLAPDSIECRVWKSFAAEKVPLISWANGHNDLVETGEYKAFSLEFGANEDESIGYAFYSLIPSKYSVLLDTVIVESKDGSWKEVQRAEELEHTVGVWMKDEEAAGGKAWSNANTLLYGPYTSIGQPGRYRVTWRVKISDSVPNNEPLLLLDVYAHDGFLNEGKRGTRSYGKLALGASEFQTPHVWENKSIDFRYDGANMLEFRAHAKWMNPGAVLLDTVEVQYLGRT